MLFGELPHLDTFFAAVAQHLRHLGILLAILFEDELSLQALVLVLPPPPDLSSLSFVLRHLAPKGWSPAVCLLVKLSSCETPLSCLLSEQGQDARQNLLEPAQHVL